VTPAYPTRTAADCDECGVIARLYGTEADAQDARRSLFNGLWLYSVVKRDGGYAVVANADGPTRLDYE
jgi:hypothetical protein